MTTYRGRSTFVSIGTQYTRVFVDHDVNAYEVVVLKTPVAVAISKHTADVEKMTALDAFLHQLLRAGNLATVSDEFFGRDTLVILSDPDDTLLFRSYLARWLSTRSSRAVREASHALFDAARCRRVQSPEDNLGCLVLDLGQHRTRLTPITRGEVVAECIRFSSGLSALYNACNCTASHSGKFYDVVEALCTRYTEQMGNSDPGTQNCMSTSGSPSPHPNRTGDSVVDETCTCDDIWETFCEFLCGLQCALEDCAQTLHTRGLAIGCLETVVMAGGGAESRPLRKILVDLVHERVPGAHLLWVA